MSDPYAKTRYRVAQHWRFHTDTPEASDTLVITAVEDHPKLSIICNVWVEYPSFTVGPSCYISGCRYTLPQEDLDRSVTELVVEKGTLPRGTGSTGEFALSSQDWKQPHCWISEGRTVGELIHADTERYKAERDKRAAELPHGPPPAESLGLWSLIAGREVGRLRELLDQHPSLADDPLPRDESDEYCYAGEEYEQCYPLMMAAEWGKVEVARLLLEFGANPGQRSARGDTALHFAGRSSCRSDGPARVADLLCAAGADPVARNAAGKTPITCRYCMTDVAEVLIRHGSPPTLNHALRLGMIDWARRELRDNPDAVRGTVFPAEVLGDIGDLIRHEADPDHGWSIPADDDPEGELTRWRREAEAQRARFEEHRDLLDMALARGADPNHGGALWDAVEMFDTSLAGWLLTNGADPNRDLKRGVATYLTDFAKTDRMAALLHRFGARDNPYTRPQEPWELERKRVTDWLRSQFG